MATIGIDLGGTKIAVGVWVSDRLVYKQIYPTPREGGQKVVLAMAEAAREALKEGGQEVDTVGVGTPGPLDFEHGVVKFAPNIPFFNNFPLRSRLEELLGMSVVLENDANAAALGEHYQGAARGASSSLYVTVSTGIGGGLVIGGKVWRGHNGQGGEVGHVTVLPGGPVCGCGLDGCLEAVASGVAIARDGRYAYKEELDTLEVFRRWQSGEAKATRIVEQAARYLGTGLASLQKALDPEVIVLGGGVALGAGEPYRRMVHAAYAEYLRGWVLGEIRLAKLGDEVGVVGAALAAEVGAL